VVGKAAPGTSFPEFLEIHHPDTALPIVHPPPSTHH
jgi:hypothetical protein